MDFYTDVQSEQKRPVKDGMSVYAVLLAAFFTTAAI